MRTKIESEIMSYRIPQYSGVTAVHNKAFILHEKLEEQSREALTTKKRERNGKAGCLA